MSDPFFLIVPETKPMRVLREVDTRIVRPPVIRPRRDWETPIECFASDADHSEVEALVIEALDRSPDTLSSVVGDILPRLEEDRRYLAIGEIAALVAEHTAMHRSEERPWVRVPGRFEIEDWRLRAEDGR